MKPPAFHYHRPASIADAVSLLGSLENAKLLAGGQSLMPMMNYRYVLPDHIIDLNRCDGLTGVRIDNGQLLIGAMTRQRDLQDDALINKHLPLFVDALHHVGHVQTRNRGTLGGSLSHLDPAAELPAVVAAYDGTLIVDGPRGTREISIHDWTADYMLPAIEFDELLTAVRIPLNHSGHRHAFVEVARRHGDFAQAGAGVTLAMTAYRIEHASIALTGVDIGPLRLHEAETVLTGSTPTIELIHVAAEHARQVPGIADVHADERYRQRLAVVVVRRALQQALNVVEPNS